MQAQAQRWKQQPWLIATLALGLALALLVPATGLAQPDTSITINPNVNDFQLPEGASHSETVTVTVPAGASVTAADVYLLMDTTGSMGSEISAMRSEAGRVVDDLVAELPDVDLQFGVGDFKDFRSPTQRDPYAFNHAQNIAADADAVRNAIDGWSASGGGDAPEAHFYAYDQIAENRAPSSDGSPAGTIGWRDDAKPILIAFADISGHDVVCQEITRQVPGHEIDYDITEDSVTAKLVANGITFIAITNNRNGMNNSSSGGDYNAACGEKSAGGASAGQADRIAAATGGNVLRVGSGDVVETVRQQITDAVSTINKLHLSPTGETAQFVTGIEPADGYGPLAGGEEHVLTFDVTWEGVVAATARDQVFTGTLDARADGSIVAQKSETITVPRFGLSLSVAPSEASGAIADEHTVTATLLDDDGEPITDAEIVFEITDGPHEGATGTSETNSDGEATFTYEGTEVGTDSIVATYTPDEGDALTSNTATMAWSEVLDEALYPPEPEETEVLDEAEAATPVEAEPDFTG